MILEHAILSVREGSGDAFQTAMREALPLIEATPGFIKLEIRKCLETENRYLLLVWWERLEDHVEGFRGSDRYQRWRALLHHFYDPFPLVEHYSAPLIASAE